MAVVYLLEKQYRSMCRAYERLEELATGIGKGTPVANHEPTEAAKNFFIECYHIKDYLKKDSRVSSPKIVENYIGSCQFLPVAADLCNSFKHAGLDHSSRSGSRIDKINMAYTVDFPLNGGEIAVPFGENPVDGDTFTINRTLRVGPVITTGRVIVTIDGKTYEALNLAEKCIKEWDAFIAQEKIQLLPP